ncbi:MAG TPA: hypothetical protein VFZ22_04440 [Pyrinomonadaceae bacterium]|nr:hypothetical protein [Pyrinomonadaceae bacterium]
MTIVLANVAINSALAQTSAAEFQQLLQEKAALDAGDFAALEQGQTIVKLAPITDKREVAVCGLVSLRSSADQFLQSYLDGMTRKNDRTVLEAGRFGTAPAVADLQQLTVEAEDIEDLKQCVVGDCQLKLSANMIERFRREVNWDAPDYQVKASELMKRMLVEYVGDYRKRGNAALIEYNDKRDEVRLADEHQALNTAPGYLNDLLRYSQSAMRLVEDAIVWSKIKFGLKPVLVINHIKVYRDVREYGPQVLVASKQIYANHYFNSSLALTGFVTVPGANQAAYLVYENRSRTDGLQGAFSKFKRGVIENRTIDGLKSVLEHSKARLDGSAVDTAETAVVAHHSPGWGQRLFGGIRPLLWVLIISALLALLVLGRIERSRVPLPRNATREKL